MTEKTLLKWDAEEQHHQVKAELKGAKHWTVTKDRNIPAFLQPQSGGISKSLPLRSYCLRRQPRHWEVVSRAGQPSTQEFMHSWIPVMRNCERVSVWSKQVKARDSALEPGQLHRASRWARGERRQSDRSQARCCGRSPHGTMTSVWNCLSHRCVKTRVQAFVSAWPSRREQCRLLSLWSWFSLFWMHMHEMLENTVISPW